MISQTVLKVGIEFAANGANLLSMINMAVNRLGVMKGKITDIHSTIGKLAIGGGLIVGGEMLLHSLISTAHFADETNKILTQMAAAGDSAAQRADAYRRSWEMAGQVVGKVSDNLEAISQLSPQFGYDNAKLMALGYRQNAVALGALTGQDGNQQAYRLEQAVHLTGRLAKYDEHGNLEKNKDGSEVVDTKRFSDTMNLFTAMIASSRGKYDAGQVLAFAKQARTSNLATISDMGFAHISGLIQAVGGSRAGTSLQAIENVAEKGQISKMGVHQLEQYGLVDQKKVIEGKGPNGVIIKEGGLTDQKLFREDPVAWVWTTVRKHIRDTLEREGKDYSDKAVNEAAKKIKLSNTAGQWIGEGLTNQPMDQREADAVVKASKTSQYGAVMQNSYAANVQAFHDALSNLGLVFGKQVLPYVTSGVKTLTGVIAGLASFFQAHQWIPQAILAVGAGLGAAMIATGVGLIASIAPWIGIPLLIGAGVATVIAAVVAVPKLLQGAWNLLKAAWSDIWHKGLLNLIADFGRWIADTVAKAGTAFVQGMGSLGGTIINAIGTLISNVISGVAHMDLGAALKNVGHVLLGDSGKLQPQPPHPAMTPPAQKAPVVHNHVRVFVDNKEAAHKAVQEQLGTGKQGFGPSGMNLAGSWAPSGAIPIF